MSEQKRPYDETFSAFDAVRDKFPMTAHTETQRVVEMLTTREKEARHWQKSLYADDLVSVLALITRQQEDLAKLREALEEIAESHDAGRHDGLPEECPAHEDVVMWSIARAALEATK